MQAAADRAQFLTQAYDFTVTEEQVEEAIKALPNQSAAGPSGLTPEGLKAAAKAVPAAVKALAEAMTACCRAAKFPTMWRQHNSLLVPKSGGGHRPICVCDVVGRVVERVLARRLTDAVQARLFVGQAAVARKGAATQIQSGCRRC